MPDYPVYNKGNSDLIYDRSLTRVQKMDDVPRTSHYAIIQFSRGTEWQPAWDERDAPSTSSFLQQTYYWTTDKAVWEKALKGAYEKAPGRDDLLAFEVRGVVKPKVIFEIDLES